MDALIGYTGFVGSNLANKRDFNFLYNSQNIETIKKKSFSKVVCAGVSAVKWHANKNPTEDAENIDKLKRCISEIQTDQFVLISTVDVYADPCNVSEADIPGQAKLQPYGLHRLRLEDFIRNSFSNVTVVRLPALFGPGLKKNIVYDLINDNNVNEINPNSRFQWYPVERLYADLSLIEAAQIKTINIAPEPIRSEEIIKEIFPDHAIAPKSNAVDYDVTTIHADVLGGHGQYHLNRAEIMDKLRKFVSDAKEGKY